ncbi:MAG: nonstructural protein [Microvirus sp.]|nr:MAG: nonstructural protein [Microvirus sp.]
MIIVGIKDLPANQFVMVAQFRTTAEFERSVIDIINSREPSLLASHPQDFELWKLADMNLQTGDVTPELKLIDNAQAYKRT